MAILYVDADACPVKDEIITIALRHKMQVIMVCNGGVRPHPHELIQLKMVGLGPDEADKWIADEIKEGDILITSDMPLAMKAVEAKGYVLRPDGSQLHEKNIQNSLATRDLMADIRASDPFFKAQSKPFSKADRGRFSQQLDQLLNRIQSQRP